MSKHPPLTRDHLRQIQEGHRRNGDVRLLLWEIHRLRAIALRADQLLQCLDEGAQHTDLIKDALREQLVGEPAIAEMNELRREILRGRQHEE